MLDTPTLAMPVDCNLTEAAIDDGAPVDVSVVDEEARPDDPRAPALKQGFRRSHS